MARISIDKERLEAFCRRWKIAELALFGSVLRDDFGPDSDVDIDVTFLPEAEHSLFDMVRMQEELKEILGREVDLVSRRGIESSRNYLRKDAILSSSETIYAAQ
ncbi:MAG: nucleotidyltransferase family protein [Thermodesulfobacteriota bacterium]